MLVTLLLSPPFLQELGDACGFDLGEDLVEVLTLETDRVAPQGLEPPLRHELLQVKRSKLLVGVLQSALAARINGRDQLLLGQVRHFELLACENNQQIFLCFNRSRETYLGPPQETARFRSASSCLPSSD